MVNNITVIIRTIGRPTLIHAINSVRSQFQNVIVVADAVDLDLESLPKDVTYLKTGQKFDKYGSAAINMGAYATTTEYFCLLDDDDEFAEGAAEFMQQRILQDPDAGIWIPGLRYNDGNTVCMNPVAFIQVGTVAVPTYKTALLFEYPFSAATARIENPHWIDYEHIKNLSNFGVRVNWYQKDIYLVRPKSPGYYGSI
jgi:glycosyltransferase involved in cell wall biosynthesis